MILKTVHRSEMDGHQVEVQLVIEPAPEEYVDRFGKVQLSPTLKGKPIICHYVATVDHRVSFPLVWDDSTEKRLQSSLRGLQLHLQNLNK